MGSNPGWMDIFSHENCIVCLKRPKINKKRPGLAFLKNVVGTYMRFEIYLYLFQCHLMNQVILASGQFEPLVIPK